MVKGRMIDNARSLGQMAYRIPAISGMAHSTNSNSDAKLAPTIPRAGDARAFDQIYETFNRRLLNFLVRMTRNRASAEDLLEETWLRLVSSGYKLDADTRLCNWLFTVARNLFLSHCRSRSRENSYTGEHSLFWPELTSRSPYDEAYLSEFGDRIERALAEIPPSYREAILLVGYQGLRPADAATVCGISPEALRQRLSRARVMLTQRMKLDETPIEIASARITR